MYTESHYSKEAVILRHPKLKDQIEKGDFKVYLKPKAGLVVEWTNTAIFRPNKVELDRVIVAEFGEEQQKIIEFHAGFMSLSIISPV